MEIDTHAQPGFVNLEEPTQPRAEEAHHLGVTVCEVDLTVSLAALAGIQRDTRRKKRLLVEKTESVSALPIEAFDLEKLSLSKRLAPSLRAVPAR
jgi:hypothetical protein